MGQRSARRRRRWASPVSNVLKLKKLVQEPERNQAGAAPASTLPLAVRSDVSPMKESSRKVRVAARKSAYKKPPAKPAAVPKPAEPEVDAIKAWKARWRSFVSKRPKNRPPQEFFDAFRNTKDNSGGNEASNPAGQIETTVTQPVDCPPAPLDLAHSPAPLPKRPRRDPLDLSSIPGTPERTSPSTHEREEPVPATPSHWSPSIRGTPSRIELADPDALMQDPDEGRSRSLVNQPNLQQKPRASLRFPSPPERAAARAQQPAVAQHQSVLEPPASAPPAQRRGSILFSSPAQEVSLGHVPSSSAPVAPFSSAIRSERGPVCPPMTRRRVPLPILGHLSPDFDASGPGRILVPNSDTSASLSQSQAQSQRSPSQRDSQSQRYSLQSLSYASQSQEHGQSQPRSQGLSQLRNETHLSPSGPTGKVSLPANAEAPDVPASQPIACVENPIVPSASGAVNTNDCEDSRPGGEVASSSQPVLGVDVPSTPAPKAQSGSESEIEGEDADDEDELGQVGHDDLSSNADRSRAANRGSDTDVELDSDDARTKELVDKYGAHRQQESSKDTVDILHLAPLSARTGTLQRLVSISSRRSDQMRKRISQASILSGRSLSSDGPLPPSSPDVFMNEKSFRATQSASHTSSSPPPRSPVRRSFDTRTSHVQSKIQSEYIVSSREHAIPTLAVIQPSNSLPLHDPAGWRKPSFMRQKAEPEKKSEDKTNNVLASASAAPLHRPKRAISLSSSPEAMDPPPKKRKTSARTAHPAEAVNGAQSLTNNTKQSATNEQTRTNRVVAEVPNPRPTIPRIDKRSGASTSVAPSIAGKKRKADDDEMLRSRWEARGASRQPPKAKPTAVSFYPLLALSNKKGNTGTSSQEGSNRARTLGSSATLLPHHAQLLQTGQMDERSSTSRPSGANSRSMNEKDSHQPLRSIEQITRPEHGLNLKAAHRQEHAGYGDREVPPGGILNMRPGHPSNLLGAYKIDFKMKRQEDGPPMIIWKDLEEALRKTGRRRHKDRQKAELRIEPPSRQK